MIFTGKQNQFNSFKGAFGYSRNPLPPHLAPPIFRGKKQEEYLLGCFYADELAFNGFKIINVRVVDDDSHKGADVEIDIETNVIKVQVTRFTLTEYLHRKNSAKKRAEKIAKGVLKYVSLNIPVNVTIHRLNQITLPPNSQNNDLAFSKEIAKLIKENKAKLANSNDFINCEVITPDLKEITPIITLQSIPNGFYSSYYGANNVFVNYEFDNVSFSEKDVEEEAQNMFNKKEGGKSDVLVIWADKFEILDQTDLVIEKLKEVFKDSLFKMVFFYSFINDNSLKPDDNPTTKAIIWHNDSFDQFSETGSN